MAETPSALTAGNEDQDEGSDGGTEVAAKVMISNEMTRPTKIGRRAATGIAR